jgi:hypothetical protein
MRTMGRRWMSIYGPINWHCHRRCRSCWGRTDSGDGETSDTPTGRLRWAMMPGALCNAKVSPPMEGSRGVGRYSSPPPLFLPRPRCHGVPWATRVGTGPLSVSAVTTGPRPLRHARGGRAGMGCGHYPPGVARHRPAQSPIEWCAALTFHDLGAASTAVNRGVWRRPWGTSPVGAGKHQKTYERRPGCMNGEAKSPLA